MISNLFAEFLSNARRLTSIALTSTAIVYVSGFIIVNAYLWDFGIARVELLQPTYIAAGILFTLIEIVTALFTLPLLSLISLLLRRAHELWNPTAQSETFIDSTSQSVSQFGNRLLGNWPQHWLISLIRAFTSLSQLYVLLAALASIAGIYLLEFGASWFIATLLVFATGTVRLSLLEFQNLLGPITRLQGISTLFILLLINYRRRLGRSIQPIATWITATTLLFVQVYTLLTIANDLYTKLPVSFGGGQPMEVQFLIEQDKAQWLTGMGISFDELPTMSNSLQTTPKLLKTEKLQMIWVLNDDKSSTYVVMPCPFPQECQPTIEISKGTVHSVIHLFPTGK